jgi:hypothetical protein
MGSIFSIIILLILNLVVCILLCVLDQVQGFPSKATLFQYLTIFRWKYIYIIST